ncbi:hypothetical protein OF83DRAFT_1167287 [Amylostereum chailletii]|nr:hypothetical protein OF83DRAFT_1167287 [Amylostereum chailletii]
MSVVFVDFYAILDIPTSATAEDIRKAYRQKVLETHPDKLSPEASEEEKVAAQELFGRVHEAFQVLGDTDNRRAYDIHQRILPTPRSDSLSFSDVASTLSHKSSVRSSASYRSYVSEEQLKRLYDHEQWSRQSSIRSRERISAIRQRRQSSTPSEALSEAPSEAPPQVRRVLTDVVISRTASVASSKASSIRPIPPRRMASGQVSLLSQVEPMDAVALPPSHAVSVRTSHIVKLVSDAQRTLTSEEYAGLVQAIVDDMHRSSPDWMARKEKLDKAACVTPRRMNSSKTIKSATS